MKRRDIQAFGFSALLHALVFVGVVNLPMNSPRYDQPEQFIEVVMGGDELTELDLLPLPEEAAPESVEEEPAPPPPVQEAEEVRNRTTQSRPVRAPRQRQPVRSPERIATPRVQPVSPVTPPQEGDREPARTDPPTPTTSSGSTSSTSPTESRPTTNPPTSQPSTSTSETGTSPSARSGFQVIGINRRVVRRSVPRHTQLVNSTIDVCIAVDPQGNVVGKYVCRKGNATLEQESLRAVSSWKFSALPQGAPQVNQNGRIRFVFVVE